MPFVHDTVGLVIQVEVDDPEIRFELDAPAFDVGPGEPVGEHHTLAAGTVAGQRWHWRGHRQGQTLVEIETLWTVGGEYPTTWPRPQDGWTLTIEREPSMRAHFLSLMSYERDLPMAEHVRAASIATAMQAINAIPARCEAPPGITTMADLPVIRTGLGFGHAPIAQPGVPGP